MRRIIIISAILSCYVLCPAQEVECDTALKTKCIHFWDKYNFRDTTPLQTPKVILDFIYLLSNIELNTAQECIRNVMDRASYSPEIYSAFACLFERYLYNTDSCFRNDELYIPVLEHIMSSATINDSAKISCRNLLEHLCRNRIGERASDLTITLRDSDCIQLHEINATYIILLFHNLECSVCRQAIADIMNSETIVSMQYQDELRIISIYPGEDIQQWAKSRFPASWLNGYDSYNQISQNAIYYIRQYPTLYLLDQDKTILIKDRSFSEIENYLMDKKQGGSRKSLKE